MTLRIVLNAFAALAEGNVEPSDIQRQTGLCPEECEDIAKAAVFVLNSDL